MLQLLSPLWFGDGVGTVHKLAHPPAPPGTGQERCQCPLLPGSKRGVGRSDLIKEGGELSHTFKIIV